MTSDHVIAAALESLAGSRHTLLAHDGLQICECMVDPIVAGERVADEGLVEDGRHGHLTKTRLHGPTPLTTGQVQLDEKTPDKRAHQIFARNDVVGIGPRLGTPADYLPHPAEEPQGRVIAILRDGEDELRG